MQLILNGQFLKIHWKNYAEFFWFSKLQWIFAMLILQWILHWNHLKKITMNSQWNYNEKLRWIVVFGIMVKNGIKSAEQNYAEKSGIISKISA